MTSETRIAINAIATYGRTILRIGLGIFSSRWVLQSLGEVDYGLNGTALWWDWYTGWLTPSTAKDNKVLSPNKNLILKIANPSQKSSKHASTEKLLIVDKFCHTLVNKSKETLSTNLDTGQWPSSQSCSDLPQWGTMDC